MTKAYIGVSRLERRFLTLLTIAFLLWGHSCEEAGSSSAISSTSMNVKPQASFGLPADWVSAWSDPPVECRPLQILHGVPRGQATPAAMKKLKESGLGGIVCNVDFNKYMASEAHWDNLVRAVEACSEVGLIVWIYDEDGYPSGAAGGLVLKRNPAFEALALTYDKSLKEPFVLRPAYEHTHASNNFYAARRYPNLIDDEAVRCFIETTHEAYWSRLKEHFGKTIQAFFTDEPSLMAVNIGPLPEDVRKNVRVVDRLDENVKPLPSVPWAGDLPAQYRKRYGQDLAAVRKSLFEGTRQSDRHVRRRFWSLVSDLVAERYFGRLQEWSQAHGVASSGHTLWEETPLYHVPLEGNALKVLGRMDIPGLDLLNSDPEAVIYNGWLTAGLPASAALLNGRRKVMTEVSDFSQRMAGKGNASLENMQATAAWQAALGVTEFTLYYNRGERLAEDYRAYCDFVGRLNAVLREARPSPEVLLYYPIYDLWAEYIPVAEKLTPQTQSIRMQQIQRSFLELGQQMVKRQIPFAIVDHELLAGADVSGAGLRIGAQRFRALVLPGGVELPKPASDKVELFRASGGHVFRAKTSQPEIDFNVLASTYTSGALSVKSDRIIVGRFVRDGRYILLIVNVGAKPYIGAVAAQNSAQWLVAEPDSGHLERSKVAEAGQISVSLAPRGAVMLIGPRKTMEMPAPH
ncbi:MAG: hypothetical protein FVQ85_12230 [Planctomycetes bacterium]|nr:hypothetical protein [Planctomycetota bacterium]